MRIGIHDGHAKGESHPMAKLTDEVVREIRKSSESSDALAARFRTWLVTSGFGAERGGMWMSKHHGGGWSQYGEHRAKKKPR